MKLEGDGRYEKHTHGVSAAGYTTCARIADSDLAPLDEVQCVILDAIVPAYTVYSTPGLLEWGVRLKVGDIVLAQLPDRRGRGTYSSDQWNQYTTAVIRWIGMGDTPFGQYHRFGVEITVSSYGHFDNST